jgi:hypothetical protein
MKTAQHTPGPWRVGDAGATVFGPNNGEPAPKIIANVGRGAFPAERNKANAHLIAAAPDLLAALIRCADFIENGQQSDNFFLVREAWRNAIAKATRGAHAKVLHGLCPVCGHYGDDCTGGT